MLHMQELDVPILLFFAGVQALHMTKFVKLKPHDKINSESATETEEIV